MSTFVKHESPRRGGAGLALAIGVVWALVLAVIWFAYRNNDGEGGGFWNFIGRFHVIVVHFPIGVIFLALIMEFLSFFTAFSHLRKSVPFILWLAVFSSVGATLMGFLLMQAEGFAGRAVDLHLYFGLSVVVFSILALVFSLMGKRAIYGLFLVAAAFCTGASGHFGGAMVHEADYLAEHAPNNLKPILLAGLSHSEETEPEAGQDGEIEAPAEVPLGERAVYADFVVPILEAKCNECHNENKIKGKLRMDTHDLLLAGAEGSDFPTVIPGNADESEMIVRVTMEPDDDEFMPPKGEPLTAEEIALLSLWIQAGANQETTVAELGDDPSIEATALAVAAVHAKSEEDVAEIAVATFESVWDTLSPEEKELRMADVLAAADKYHFSVMPISAEDDRLRVNVINAAKEFGDEQLKLLEPVAERVVWLDLARSQVTDTGMKVVGKMRSLERLHLENTKVTDAGVSELTDLNNLEYLNLYGTGVGNGIFETFAALPNLRRVYLWQTGVDPTMARAFERSVNLEINTGVELAATTDPVEPIKEQPEPVETPEPKPEAKPAEKKKEAPVVPAAKPEVAAKPKEAPKPVSIPEKKPEPKNKPEPEPRPAAAEKPKENPKPAPKSDTPPAPKPAPKTPTDTSGEAPPPAPTEDPAKKKA